jgi:hypothetical protein
MPNQFSRIAQRTALSSLIASCLAAFSHGMAQEPFILIPSSPSGQTGTNEKADTQTPPKTDRPKQRTPNIPAEPNRDLPNDSSRDIKPSLTLEEPPLLKSFPSSPSKSNAINDDGVLILGKIDAPVSNSSKVTPKSISPINDQLPVVRNSPQVQETEDAQFALIDSSSNDPMDVITSLSLPWQLANASSFPLSPIHLWQGIRLEPVVRPTPAKSELTNSPNSPDDTRSDSSNKIAARNDGINLGESTESTDFQPQLMAQSPQSLEPLKLDDSIARSTKPDIKDRTAASNTSETKSSDSASSEPKTKRNVRIPFGDEETAVTDEPVINPRLNSSPPSSLTELEEQKGQEAPIIDAKSLDRAKDEQGADALQASKPATPPKRKIKIDDPQLEGQLVPAKPTDAPTVINAADTLRLRRAQACLDHYLNFPESTSVRSPWAVMHALLPYGGDYEMIHGNQRVNAIGWMCHNGTCRTQRIFTPSRNGFIPNIGGGVQGHAGQFMAILAQCGVPLDYPIQVGNQKYKVEDLVRYEMATCREKSELTFKLIGLSYYSDSNKQWRSNDGKVWSIPKLISEELAQPIKGAACGGTHRLMGYSFAVKQRTIQGLPIDGQYARADKFVKDYVEYAWKLQNPDGSFSTSWLEGRGDEQNEERKVQTTGHILEWLLFTIPDSELNTPKVQKSVDFLLTKIYDKKEYKWPIGPRGHATRAVSLYLNRYDEIKMSKPELLRADTKTASPRNSEPFNRR